MTQQFYIGFMVGMVFMLLLELVKVLLRSKRKKQIVDLYHIQSRALFWDITNQRMIEGKKAILLHKKTNQTNRLRWIDYKEGIKVYDKKYGTIILHGNLYAI